MLLTKKSKRLVDAIKEFNMIDKIKKLKNKVVDFIRLRVKFIRFKEKNKREVLINNKEKKLNMQKVKEVGLLVFAAVLIVIGYTNFSNKTNDPKEMFVDTVSVSTTNNIGDVQLVSSESAIVENEETENVVQETASNGALVSNSESNLTQEKIESDIETAQTSSSSNSNYFAELKKDRDDMYSKNIETYQKIVDSPNISSEQKSIAIQEINKINQTKNAIQTAEELIKLKDFEDAVIYSSNGQVSVIVRVAVLSETQVAQIQNIVSKELGVELQNITISNK